MGNSKIVYYGEVLLDLTADTIKADKILKGFTGHGADGEPITGTCPFDMDTSEMNAAASEILAGKKAGVKGSQVVGTMPNNGGVTLYVKSIYDPVPIAQGCHDGSGKACIDPEEAVKLNSENIRAGVDILGVSGSMTGTEDANPQTVTVTPAKTAQTVLPDTAAGYNYLAQVMVKGVPYSESENSAGGITVTIG